VPLIANSSARLSGVLARIAFTPTSVKNPIAASGMAKRAPGWVMR
jgi:hypothetical protein